jgi:DNA-binding response OmpR family regulator
MSRARLLCVDDEPRILSFVSRGLSVEGFDVDTASTKEHALQRVRTRAYDLVILDLLMPGVDGRSLLRSVITDGSGAPVLVLSCVGDSAVRVECLDMGAADYLEKPFVFDELLARVRLRMHDSTSDHPEQQSVGEGPRGQRTVSTAGGSLTLDLVSRVADAGGGGVVLTEREFQVLLQLLDRPGETVSKQRLLSSVWDYHFDPGSNVVDVCVWRLREKLGHDVITTVRGHGYRIDAR